MVPVPKFLETLPVTPTTFWRWRKKGLINPLNINGKNYLTQQAIEEFYRNAADGKFSKIIKPGRPS